MSPDLDELVAVGWSACATDVYPADVRRILTAVLPLVLKGPREALDIALRYEESSHDCETCGWYTNKRMTLTAAGRPALELSEDGHYGGSDDLSDPASLARKILDWAGHTVEFSQVVE